ncbi:MAG: peptidase [Solirubrobacterales bacterium]|nr:peptidase [Solirubrobacterales bacterium]
MRFESGGETLAAWHLTGDGDAFERPAGRPCVVMAHGIGGTRDSGLLPFAEAFAEAGLDVLLFDYRSFGDSTGEPRQQAWPPHHREDYRAAVAFARGLGGVDSERVVLWGSAWSGGHVVYVAAEDNRIAAVISQTADLDGMRTVMEIVRDGGLGQLLRLTAHGLRDAVAALRGAERHNIPIVARPGSLAAMSSEEAQPGYESIAGPTWRNEVTGTAALAEGMNRPISRVGDISCPILIQVAERDSITPPAAGKAAAWRAKGRSEVREYPCNHFDIYKPPWRERAIADQVHFLRRHLGARSPAEESAVA